MAVQQRVSKTRTLTTIAVLLVASIAILLFAPSQLKGISFVCVSLSAAVACFWGWSYAGIHEKALAYHLCRLGFWGSLVIAISCAVAVIEFGLLG